LEEGSSNRIINFMKRLFAGVIAIAMVATFSLGSAGSAQAATVAEIMAMIATLQAQLAGMTGGTTGGYTFSADLTVGSTGNDVSELQKVLVSKGYLTMPAGVAMGYFGNLTKSAVAAWQAASGISPAAGYFGPISRGAMNSMASTPTVPTTPGSTTGITTPGVEGTLTASVNPTPGAGTKLYEGDSKRVVLGIELEAKTSDIKVERIKIDLDCVTCTPGSDQDVYDDIANTIYVMDGSTVLASMSLNSSTVVKDGTDYFITVSGLNFIVPKGSTKVLDIALDAQSNFDSTFNGDSWSLGIPTEGVRGIDGAGISQYSPTTGFSRSFTSEADLADSATFQVSTNSATPKSTTVIASEGSSENELDGLELLRFDAKAEDDDVTLTDLVVDITRGGAGVATATTAYLYDGSTLVGSAAVVGTSATVMGATFDDIDYVVSRDTTKTFTIKVDIDSAAAAADTFIADIDTADVTAENSSGDSITESGSASGNTFTVHNKGPQFTLVSKSIEKSATAAQGNNSTSTAKATFTIKVKAVGGDVLFGTVSSGSPMFGSSTTFFKVYLNSAATTLLVASSTDYSAPSSGVVNSTNTFTLQENNEVTIPVSFLFEARTTPQGVAVSTGSYAVGLESIQWTSAGGVVSTTFMAGDLDWRTSSVSLP
jgi:peptidoglycan hydrolase-like protein with peptidoglycan-binding domain